MHTILKRENGLTEGYGPLSLTFYKMKIVPIQCTFIILKYFILIHRVFTTRGCPFRFCKVIQPVTVSTVFWQPNTAVILFCWGLLLNDERRILFFNFFVKSRNSCCEIFFMYTEPISYKLEIYLQWKDNLNQVKRKKSCHTI